MADDAAPTLEDIIRKRAEDYARFLDVVSQELARSTTSNSKGKQVTTIPRESVFSIGQAYASLYTESGKYLDKLFSNGEKSDNPNWQTETRRLKLAAQIRTIGGLFSQSGFTNAQKYDDSIIELLQNIAKLRSSVNETAGITAAPVLSGQEKNEVTEILNAIKSEVEKLDVSVSEKDAQPIYPHYQRLFRFCLTHANSDSLGPLTDVIKNLRDMGKELDAAEKKRILASLDNALDKVSAPTIEIRPIVIEAPSLPPEDEMRELTMEEILASIRRIIGEGEDLGQPTPAALSEEAEDLSMEEILASIRRIISEREDFENKEQPASDQMLAKLGQLADSDKKPLKDLIESLNLYINGSFLLDTLRERVLQESDIVDFKRAKEEIAKILSKYTDDATGLEKVRELSNILSNIDDGNQYSYPSDKHADIVQALNEATESLGYTASVLNAAFRPAGSNALVVPVERATSVILANRQEPGQEEIREDPHIEILGPDPLRGESDGRGFKGRYAPNDDRNSEENPDSDNDERMRRFAELLEKLADKLKASEDAQSAKFADDLEAKANEFNRALENKDAQLNDLAAAMQDMQATIDALQEEKDQGGPQIKAIIDALSPVLSDLTAAMKASADAQAAAAKTVADAQADAIRTDADAKAALLAAQTAETEQRTREAQAQAAREQAERDRIEAEKQAAIAKVQKVINNLEYVIKTEEGRIANLELDYNDNRSIADADKINEKIDAAIDAVLTLKGPAAIGKPRALQNNFETIVGALQTQRNDLFQHDIQDAEANFAFANKTVKDHPAHKAYEDYLREEKKFKKLQKQAQRLGPIAEGDEKAAALAAELEARQKKAMEALQARAEELRKYNVEEYMNYRQRADEALAHLRNLERDRDAPVNSMKARLAFEALYGEAPNAMSFGKHAQIDDLIGANYSVNVKTAKNGTVQSIHLSRFDGEGHINVERKGKSLSLTMQLARDPETGERAEMSAEDAVVMATKLLQGTKIVNGIMKDITVTGTEKERAMICHALEKLKDEYGVKEIKYRKPWFNKQWEGAASISGDVADDVEKALTSRPEEAEKPLDHHAAGQVGFEDTSGKNEHGRALLRRIESSPELKGKPAGLREKLARAVMAEMVYDIDAGNGIRRNSTGIFYRSYEGIRTEIDSFTGEPVRDPVTGALEKSIHVYRGLFGTDIRDRHAAAKEALDRARTRRRELV